jgi:hypothetical protein
MTAACRRFLSVSVTGVLVASMALPWFGFLSPAFAASHGTHPILIQGSGLDPARHLTVDSRAIHANFTGTHYLYVDDGGPGASGGPDSIEVFKITSAGSTRIQNFLTGAVQVSWFPGSNSLAYSKLHNCLILAAWNGFMESFRVSPVTHLVTTAVSHIPDPHGGNPEDVHINALETTAYMADATAKLSSWRIAVDCALTYLSTSTGGSGSEGYGNLALTRSTRLVSADTKNATIDTYALTATGGITLLKKAASQVSRPAGITVTGGKLFTGKADTGPATAQGGKYSAGTGAIAYFKGSPASDPGGFEGIPVLFDAANHTLVEGNVVSSRLSNFSVSGTPTTMAFASATSLAKSGFVDDLTKLQSTLFVNGVTSADIEACRLGAGGASGCASFATLTNKGGLSNGLAVT